MTPVQPAGALTFEEARHLQENLREPVRPGLTGSELDDVERRFGFRFAADHRTFLSAGVPIGDRWPDWRCGNTEQLRKRLAWPVDGVLYDVEHNGFWLPDWGTRPVGPEDAVREARRRLADVPQLVPVCGHRYLPGFAGTAAGVVPGADLDGHRRLEPAGGQHREHRRHPRAAQRGRRS